MVISLLKSTMVSFAITGTVNSHRIKKAEKRVNIINRIFYLSVWIEFSVKKSAS